ncbi:hypothetical protein SCMU_30940 [Sinomonas cyclohexanicum]|uniref:PRC-barrel domain-containing protein n=1 Tax=Sinomonas cyclohexanicum TaxID=322009 RepID=A0ABM7PY77_SINCY|nr:hypothetical protein [Corynebacterium cyclohexanicum]BCT77252.1 hypothetical protein SCMU_30940 [Corynebacterium cyclohexanicum]
MISRDELDTVLEAGGRLLASDGTGLGSIDQLVLDASGAPAFVSVRAGFFGIAQRFVPLDGATLEGSTIRIAFDGELVRSAPQVASDRGGLGERDANALREHYGLPAEIGSGDAEMGSGDVEIGSGDAEMGSGDAGIGSPSEDTRRNPPPPPLPRRPHQGPRHPGPPRPHHPRPAPPHDGPPSPPVPPPHPSGPAG